MFFRRGHRCWQCLKPLAIDAAYCPLCGAHPDDKGSEKARRKRRARLLDWLVDSAVWLVAVIAVAVIAPFAIRSISNSGATPSQTEQSGGEEDSASSQAVAGFFDLLKAWPLSRVPTDAVPAEVIEIVSGDSFLLDLRDHEVLVTLIGTLAPEPTESRWPGSCYAEESLAQLREVLPEGTVLFVARDDADTLERGGVTVSAYLWFADRGEQIAFLINELIVADGDAVAFLPIADPEIGARIQVAENEARSDAAGLWGSCGSPPQSGAWTSGGSVDSQTT